MVAIDLKYNFGFEVTMNVQKQNQFIVIPRQVANYFFFFLEWIQSKSTLLEEMLQKIIEN